MHSEYSAHHITRLPVLASTFSRLEFQLSNTAASQHLYTSCICLKRFTEYYFPPSFGLTCTDIFVSLITLMIMLYCIVWMNVHT